jgi:hypothetical protein
MLLSRDKALPTWLWVLLIAALPGTILFACRLVYEETLMTWRQGEQMVGFTLMHVFPFLYLWMISLDISGAHRVDIRSHLAINCTIASFPANLVLCFNSLPIYRASLYSLWCMDGSNGPDGWFRATWNELSHDRGGRREVGTGKGPG